MTAPEYRIEFQIQRQLPGDDDFTEIGFGSSGACRDLDECTFSIECGVGNSQWETEPGQPDPAEVMAEIAAVRALR